MKTAPGRRFALLTMGLGMVAGATGFAALHGSKRHDLCSLYRTESSRHSKRLY
jgi:hypothetical protein